jgi:hypothetical protein
VTSLLRATQTHTIVDTVEDYLRELEDLENLVTSTRRD